MTTTMIFKSGGGNYPDKFKAGDVAVAKQSIDFCDGTKHEVGERIVIERDCVSYFNVCHKYYDKE